MKACPFCAESVQDAAIKCRYCGADLPPGPGSVGSGGSGRDLLPLVAIGAAALLVVALGVGAGLVMRWRHAPPADAGGQVASRTATEPYDFGVRWGAPPETVSMQLMGRGLAFTEHDEDGDQVYSGTVDGNQAVVIAMFARGGLAKVIVAYQMPADPQAAFASTVKRLTQRYGPPSGAPATAAARTHPVTTWPPRAGATGDTRVWVTVTDANDVAVHYESGGWKDEAARRRGAP